VIEDANKLSVQVEVIPALREQESILDNLIQLYAYDFSELHEVEIGSDGRFTYRDLPLYWSEEGHHPFLVRVNTRLAGFVLVKKGSEVSGDDTTWDMAEFFVLRGYRRRGVGTRVAEEVWRRFPGPWEVRVMETNVAARSFWQRVISGFILQEVLPRRITFRDECRWLFAFESRPNGPSC
jgi:predicted acetyltransferase